MKFLNVFLAALLAFVAGTVVLFVLWIALVLGMVGSMSGSAPVVEEQSILKIDLSEVISDAPSTDPMAGLDLMTMQATPQLSLYSALRAIDAAAGDERIKGIYLRMNGAGATMETAVMEELRETLVQFKESGKFILSYNESYTQGSYYLASVADKIYLQPEGSMEWSGLASNLIFFKGLIDKLGLDIEIFRPTACRYKSAVEPYFMTRMSDENRAQMQALVDSTWKTLTENISKARGISVEELNRLADELEVMLPMEAVEHKLIDGVCYEDEMEEKFLAQGVEADKEGNLRFVSLGDYAAQVGPDLDHLTSPEVALVYAQGEIVDGEGSGAQIFGNSLAAKLREVREDENVKAVVLRVNSPGGSALASDVIWREMELLKAQKPVIVSMGSYAASGGYYISAPADAILSDRMTLTGSIGVFGMFMNPTKALQKNLGITMDGVKTNRSAGMGQREPLTAAERRAVMRGVDKVYERFTGLVSEGRNLPIEKVLEIAGGRVWSGSDALEIGLVDGLGGLKMALALAAEKADLGEDFQVVEKTEVPTGFAAVMSALSAKVKAEVSSTELEKVMEEYQHVKEALQQQGIVMYSPYRLELN
ncbi:MAG: signal peptide peptidase SppA [Alistipes sp.]|nr:signal peptide peptidase SppA [Alistipes sp.]